METQSNPYGSPPPDPGEAVKVWKSISVPMRLLMVLYLCAALWGVAQVVSPASTRVDTFFSLLFAFIATWWTVVDSRRIGAWFPGILRAIFFFIWPVASLLYLITTRKFFGLGWWLLNAVGLFATACLTFYPTFFLLYLLGLIDPDQFEYF